MAGARNWAKIDALLWQGAKLSKLPREDRFWAGLAFFQLLLINRAHHCDGLIPGALASPNYLVEWCHIDAAPEFVTPANLLRAGLIAAHEIRLIDIGPEGVRIVGWDTKWRGRHDSSTERTRRWRAKQKVDPQESLPLDTPKSSPCCDESDASRDGGDASDGRVEESRGDQRREEKSVGSAGAADPSPSDPQESAPEDPSGKKVDPSKIPALAHTLAQMLADYIVENLPTGTLAKMVERKRAHRVLTWADTIRLMHSADKHSWDEIQAMLVWSQRSDFWRANVQSGAGLRRNWDQMAAQRVRGKSATATTGQVAATSAAEFEKEPEVSEL